MHVYAIWYNFMQKRFWSREKRQNAVKWKMSAKFENVGGLGIRQKGGQQVPKPFKIPIMPKNERLKNFH